MCHKNVSKIFACRIVSDGRSSKLQICICFVSEVIDQWALRLDAWCLQWTCWVQSPIIFALVLVSIKAVYSSLSWFVHDSSFTIVKCRKCSTLSIRQRPRKYDEPTFSVFLNVGSIIGAPSVIRMSLKYIWFCVHQKSHATFCCCCCATVTAALLAAEPHPAAPMLLL